MLPTRNSRNCQRQQTNQPTLRPLPPSLGSKKLSFTPSTLTPRIGPPPSRPTPCPSFAPARSPPTRPSFDASSKTSAPTRPWPRPPTEVLPTATPKGQTASPPRIAGPSPFPSLSSRRLLPSRGRASRPSARLRRAPAEWNPSTSSEMETPAGHGPRNSSPPPSLPPSFPLSRTSRSKDDVWETNNRPPTGAWNRVLCPQYLSPFLRNHVPSTTSPSQSFSGNPRDPSVTTSYENPRSIKQVK